MNIRHFAAGTSDGFMMRALGGGAKGDRMMEPDEETTERNGNGNLNRRFLFKLVRFSGLRWVLRVMVAPCASIRGDAGYAIKVGDKFQCPGCAV